jgi:acyl carrier protein
MSVYAAVRADIQQFLAENYEIELDALAPDATLEDSGFDSLGLLGIATLLENKYGLKFETHSMFRVQTFKDLIAVVQTKCTELA